MRYVVKIVLIFTVIFTIVSCVVNQNEASKKILEKDSGEKTSSVAERKSNDFAS